MPQEKGGNRGIYICTYSMEVSKVIGIMTENPKAEKELVYQSMYEKILKNVISISIMTVFQRHILH